MPIFVLLFALAGAVVLVALTRVEELAFAGALLGAILGYVAGLGSRTRRLERRIRALEALVRTHEAQAAPPREPVARTTADSEPDTPLQQASPETPIAAAPRAPAPATAIRREQPADLDREISVPRGRRERMPPRSGSAWFRNLLDQMRAFLGRGNPVVQVGVVVVFFGVAFLIKYAAERDLVPIELRLAGVALAGLAMIVVGWRLRTGSLLYANVLQGGGVGILYLTVYAAAKLYGLMPAGLAFLIMVGLVALSGVLAVLQNALSLALFGTAGGFLAPVLASTGSGNHVMLFAYYAVLNAGIFGIAWFRAWRVLNLMGFVFTFVIGSLWGFRYYRPEHFTTTEPFLVLFFLFYVAIAVLYAHRRPPRLRGYVDAGLVFGVPLVAFSLQTALVKDFEYGLAFSALTLGGFYLATASALWRRGASSMLLLSEAFLALGVVFASLAIPLALDGRWTAAAWALEGAAMVWIGIRQSRWQARLFGVLLQIGAGLAFLTDSGPAARGLPVLNGMVLGGIGVALAALFSAWYLQLNRDRLLSWERVYELPLLVWGLLWWFGSGLSEIGWQLSGRTEGDAAVCFIALSALSMGWLGQYLRWVRLTLPAVGLLPVLCLAAAGQLFDYGFRNPLGGWGLLAWPLALAASYRLLWHMEPVWPKFVVRYWHPLSLWLLLLLLSRELDWLIHRGVQGAATWRFIAWALVPGLAVAFLWRHGRRLAWPVRAHFASYGVTGLLPIALYLVCWVLAASVIPGNPRPLPYLPIVNPLDLAQAFALIGTASWCLWLDSAEERPSWWPQRRVWTGALGAAAFVWMNTVLARTVHFWGGVGYNLDTLHQSVVFQAAVAILWTLTASAFMVLSKLKSNRVLWFLGAGLLAAVVVKLFLVDLAGIGTVARIISFLAVGGLMLVIGYFAPLPPRPANPETPT